MASLSAYYAINNKPLLRKIVVNSRYRVREAVDYDNWDGGTYGHDLYMQVPSAVFYEVLDKIDGCASDIRGDINKLANVQREHISNVFVELLEEEAASDWREGSGLLVHADAAVRPAEIDQESHLWTPGFLRMFLSHKAEHKRETSALKDEMAEYGVSCFVAHEDIEPTKDWQVEIERALLSMEVLAALLTPTFSESRWTDQEVGAAVGRRTPVLAIRLGKDPYGFIGKYQAVHGLGTTAKDLAQRVYDLLWKTPRLHTRLAESLVVRFKSASSFGNANTLMPYLEKIQRLPPHLIEQLDSASQTNRQVRDAWEVQQNLPVVLQRLRNVP